MSWQSKGTPTENRRKLTGIETKKTHGNKHLLQYSDTGERSAEHQRKLNGMK
jgi:hypothetical protein